MNDGVLERIATALERIANNMGGPGTTIMTRVTADPKPESTKKKGGGRPRGSTNKKKKVELAPAVEAIEDLGLGESTATPVVDTPAEISDTDVRDELTAIINAHGSEEGPQKALAMLQKFGSDSASGVPQNKRAAFLIAAKESYDG